MRACLVERCFVCGPASWGGVLLCADDKVEKGEEKDPALVTQSDEAPAEEDHLGPNCYYDKSKSFFDNISSELKTRSEGLGAGEEDPEGLVGDALRLGGPRAGTLPKTHSAQRRQISSPLSHLSRCFLSPADPGGLRALLPEAAWEREHCVLDVFFT